jgi:lipopolysaccharide export system permease protein
MNRLSVYLVRLFFRETLALMAVVLGLLFLVQCLKIFDIISVQGQNLWTLVGQALLGMPPLAIVLVYVCMGIGLVRGLGALQRSQELHIIHTNRKLGSLFGAIAMFAAGGTLFVLLISNFIEPAANRRLNDWAASVAADIVGRTLTPHRFSQVVSGVTVVIGGREGTGHIVDFFADDRRDPDMRHTYIAKTATVATDTDGYVLELHDGAIQYLSSDKDFSEISFKKYNVTLNKLTEPLENRDQLAERDTADLVLSAVRSGNWAPDTIRRLIDRFSEGLRAISMCAFIAGLAAFPHARRGKGRMPLEAVPLIVAFVESGINTYSPGTEAEKLLAGPLVMLLLASLILLYRLRVFHPSPTRLRLA